MKGLSEMKSERMGIPLTSFFTIVIMAIFLVISGCSQEKREKPKASKVVKKVPAPAKEPQKQEAASETEQVEDTFAGYTATVLRDPFLPFLKEEVVAVRRGGALTPLEKFDLGELKVVGVLMKRNETVALIEDNEGKGYTVKKGVKIGRNGGVISEITAKDIIVIEEYFDITGRKVTKEKRLMLPQPGGE